MCIRDRYIENIRTGSNIYAKIRRDKLYAMNSDGTPFAICSIYAALVFQTEYEGKNYIFCSGSWYQVETSFFNRVDVYKRQVCTLSIVAILSIFSSASVL